MKKLILAPILLLLTACNQSVGEREIELCQSATDRLPRSLDERNQCQEKVAAARNKAWDEAAQEFRNKPRNTP
jgi:hypothetical protein